MATVKAKPATLSALRQAATLVKKEVSKADTNRDGKLSRAEVQTYAKSLRNKALGDALVVAHGLGSRSMDGASTLSLNQVRVGVDLALGYVADRDTNRNGKIDAGAELKSAEKLKSFQALAKLADTLNLTGGGVDRGLPALQAALKTANGGVFEGYNRAFDVHEFPAGTKDRDVMAKVMDWEPENLTADDLEVRFTGRQGITRFFASIGDEQVESVTNANDAAEERQWNRAFDTGLKAMRSYVDQAGLKNVGFFVHDIAEDGDTMWYLLMGTRPDGSRVALTYMNNPF